MAKINNHNKKNNLFIELSKCLKDQLYISKVLNKPSNISGILIYIFNFILLHNLFNTMRRYCWSKNDL